MRETRWPSVFRLPSLLSTSAGKVQSAEKLTPSSCRKDPAGLLVPAGDSFATECSRTFLSW